MQENRSDFVGFMVRSGALRFGDFVTKSGRKTPFFVNTGNYASGSQLRALGSYYARAIESFFGLNFSCLFGPAYKGIPLAVAASMALYEKYGFECAYASARKEEKGHGDGGTLLGGPIQDGSRVLLIEDVTTAGTSVREAVPYLASLGNVEVVGLIVSIDRMERGQGEKSALEEISSEFGFPAFAIATIADVVETLYQKEFDGKIIIGDEEMERLRAYYRQYGPHGSPF
jgi:orotate phosphoribosyltransferase